LIPGEVKMATKMSSLIKLRIIDHELCVSEYGLRPNSQENCPVK
jgi:hypothetical protein